MKPFNILILILMSTLFFSCEKEEIKPPKYDFPTVTVNGVVYGISIDSYNPKFSCASAVDGNNCSGDLYIPDSVLYQGKMYAVRYIYDDFLHETENITSVSIPATTKYIYGNTFYKCKNLKEVIFRDSNQPVEVYGTYKVEKFGALCKGFNIQKLYMGRACWMFVCDSLDTIHIGPTVTYISNNLTFGYGDHKKQ